MKQSKWLLDINKSTIQKFRELIAKLCDYRSPETLESMYKRDIICTPCKYNEGVIYYWIVAINGSPPKGTLFIESLHGDNYKIIFISPTTDKVKLIYEWTKKYEYNIIKAFINEYLTFEYKPDLMPIIIKGN